ncbi:MAG: iron-containing alcohol dehydrogenase [Candidatus Diapherotrites archaeon]
MISLARGSFTYLQPTKIIFGAGSFSRAGELAKPCTPKKTLLVTGRSSMRKFGFVQKLEKQMRAPGSEVILYEKISQNPPEGEVDEGAEICRREGIDFVVALGGGSAMDAGKAIAALARNEGKCRDYLIGRKTFACKGLPCMCIPTTSGTSSEISRYSVITLMPENKKKGMASGFLHADLALIDPELAKTMPPDVTAATGLDVLAHAVEAYWNTASDPISRNNALKAIELVSANLPRAYKNGGNMQARTNMSLSTIFAGLAFNGPGTTSLHAVSYYLTTNFGLAHGSACAIAMPAFMRFNAEKDKHTLLEISRAMGQRDVESAAQFVERLLKRMNVPTHLSQIGATEKGLDAIVKDSMRPNMLRNPRRVSEKELKKLLRGIL